MADVLPFPSALESPHTRDLVEVVAAVGLVASGVAERVRLVNLAEPLIVAGEAAARASAAGIDFHVATDTGHVELIVGPRR